MDQSSSPTALNGLILNGCRSSKKSGLEIFLGFQTPWEHQASRCQDQINNKQTLVVMWILSSNCVQCGRGLQTHLVVGVVDHRGLPLALVAGVIDHRAFPGATAGGWLADGVRDLRSLPFTVHVHIPDAQETHGYQVEHGEQPCLTSLWMTADIRVHQRTSLQVWRLQDLRCTRARRPTSRLVSLRLHLEPERERPRPCTPVTNTRPGWGHGANQ